MPTAATTSPRVFVARQPILDRSGRVFAYELLHREPTTGPGQAAVSDERATARVLTDGLLAIGFEALTGGSHAFINVSRQFLLDGVPAGLPPGTVVFGIGADVEADDDVVRACQGLHAVGFSLAIDRICWSPLNPTCWIWPAICVSTSNNTRRRPTAWSSSGVGR